MPTQCSLSLALSLSHSHIHTHTHTYTHFCHSHANMKVKKIIFITTTFGGPPELLCVQRPSRPLLLKLIFSSTHFQCKWSLTTDHASPYKTSASFLLLAGPPQWGAADAEIKVLSVGNTEFKGSPFKAWSRSVYSHACYIYCQGFPPG